MRTLKERFDEKWIPVPECGCWLWTATATGNPSSGVKYGYISVGGRSRSPQRAHRVSYELYNGEIPEGLIVRHKCDNPLCVNPDHLELGTHADNSRDMVKRGRSNKKAYCKRGHELNEENAYTNSRGHKYCKVCKRERQREKHRAERGDRFGKPEYRVRTHCRHGHEFTDQNTYTRPDGYKECRACRVDRAARFKRNRDEI
jgi:hypothetical protein